MRVFSTLPEQKSHVAASVQKNRVRNGTDVQDVLPPIKIHNLGNAGNAKAVRKRDVYCISHEGSGSKQTGFAGRAIMRLQVH
jgi:hypothetical protein